MADDAFVTPLISLRPSTPADPASARPCPALVVRLAGTPRQREAVLRALLRLGWEIAGSLTFEPQPTAQAAVTILDGGVLVEAGGETLYAGPLPLASGPAGNAWADLANDGAEVLVFVTVGSEPILTEDAANRVARDGHLVGAAGLIIQPAQGD